MIDDFYERILKKIRVEIKRNAEHLVKGDCPDFENYKFNVGKIQALEQFEGDIMDTYKMYIMEPKEKDDNEISYT